MFKPDFDPCGKGNPAWKVLGSPVPLLIMFFQSNAVPFIALVVSELRSQSKNLQSAVSFSDQFTFMFGKCVPQSVQVESMIAKIVVSRSLVLLGSPNQSACVLNCSPVSYSVA